MRYSEAERRRMIDQNNARITGELIDKARNGRLWAREAVRARGYCWACAEHRTHCNCNGRHSLSINISNANL